MGHDQNLRESSVNVISLFTICTKSEIHEWQFSLFFMILSEKLANFFMISLEITEITEIGSEWDFTIWNWSETWFRETLEIVFEREFSVNPES